MLNSSAISTCRRRNVKGKIPPNAADEWSCSSLLPDSVHPINSLAQSPSLSPPYLCHGQTLHHGIFSFKPSTHRKAAGKLVKMSNSDLCFHHLYCYQVQRMNSLHFTVTVARRLQSKWPFWSFKFSVATKFHLEELSVKWLTLSRLSCYFWVKDEVLTAFQTHSALQCSYVYWRIHLHIKSGLIKLSA